MLVQYLWFGLFIFFTSLLVATCQVDLRDYFRRCQLNSSELDNCITDGINNLRPYFKTGLPDYGIKPLEPIHFSEIREKQSGYFMNTKIIIRNATDSGWAASKFTAKTDFRRNSIHLEQFFPYRKVSGLYDLDGIFFGLKYHTKGSFNIGLYDFTQTLDIIRKSKRDTQRQVVQAPLKVKVNMQNCKHFEVRFEHLLGGTTILENTLNLIYNRAWPLILFLFRPLINDISSTIFTDKFNENFGNFPFDQVFS